MWQANYAYEQTLGIVPNTAIVYVDERLNIRQIYDGSKLLKTLFLGRKTLREWSSALNVDLIKDLKYLYDLGQEDRQISREVDYYSGVVHLSLSSFREDGGKLHGVIIFQMFGMHSEKSERRLIREKEEAEENNEIKSRFLARISHEIRTPLNAIIGFIEQLQKTKLDAVQSNYTGIVEKSSAYLLDLVNEILSFSRLESGEMKLDNVDFSLENLLAEVYNTLKVKASEKNINLRYSLDEKLNIICYGDAFRLKQVLLNLVSNGIKFTEYGYVELRVLLTAESEDHIRVCFTIEDSGIGIPKRKLSEIFEEYKQASAGIARKHGGSGLGLTISKRLVEVMKGSISVDSEEGKGSVFTVDIPLKRSKKKFLSKDILQVDSEELSGRHVLLIDDDAMNRALGQIILEGFNMEVSLVTDGREAMEQFKKGRFELVLLDIHMPDISGFEVADYIRNQVGDQQVKIIAVTADILQEDKEELANSRIDDVLIKPYKEVQLYNKICKVLEVDSRIILKESIELKTLEKNQLSDFDLSELEAVTRGNKDFFNEMIDTFIGNATEGIEQLQNAFATNNWKEIREISHRLTPSFKHLKMNGLVSDLVEIKSQSKTPVDRELLGDLLQHFEKRTLENVASLKTKKRPADGFTQQFGTHSQGH